MHVRAGSYTTKVKTKKDTASTHAPANCALPVYNPCTLRLGTAILCAVSHCCYYLYVPILWFWGKLISSTIAASSPALLMSHSTLSLWYSHTIHTLLPWRRPSIRSLFWRSVYWHMPTPASRASKDGTSRSTMTLTGHVGHSLVLRRGTVKQNEGEAASYDGWNDIVFNNWNVQQQRFLLLFSTYMFTLGTCTFYFLNTRCTQLIAFISGVNT